MEEGFWIGPSGLNLGASAHFGRRRMASETSVKLLFASFSVVSLEGRCDKEPGEKKPKGVSGPPRASHLPPARYSRHSQI